MTNLRPTPTRYARIISVMWIVWITVVSSAGCDSLANPTYAGEPLQNLNGSIDLEGPVQAELLLAWTPIAGWQAESGTAVHLGQTFPSSRYRLSLFHYPPEFALQSLDTRAGFLPTDSPAEARIGIASVLLVAPTLVTQGLALHDQYLVTVKEITETLRGSSVTDIVVYTDRLVEYGSAAYRLIGIELQPGFHVLGLEARSADEVSAALQCEERASSWHEWLSCPSPVPRMVPRLPEVRGPNVVPVGGIQELLDWSILFPPRGQ